MGEHKNLCILIAEIVGGPSLDSTTSGALEVRHAVDRCVRRIDLAVEANQGSLLKRKDDRIEAHFDRCDPAVLAACEILERTQNLPPLRGKRFAVRVGIHYGQPPAYLSPAEAFEDPDPARGEGGEDDIATRLCIAARGGEAIATNAVAMQLSQATRQFARLEPVQKDDLAEIEWSLFTVSRQPDAVVSLPPATRLLQRLRIRHQDEIIYVDETRPIALFGREFGNDVVIMDPRASRQHARIERRRGGFVLVDYSTNGTFVVEDAGSERLVKGEEVALVGPGRIGCGFSAKEVERDLVFFELV